MSHFDDRYKLLAWATAFMLYSLALIIGTGIVITLIQNAK